MTQRKAVRGNGSKVRPANKTTVFDKLESTADLAHAALLEEAAQILGQSIFRNQFSSPHVAKLEEALRLLFITGAAYHRFRANHFRRDAGFLFDARQAA